MDYETKYDVCINGIPRINPYSRIGPTLQAMACCVVALMEATGWTYRFTLDFCRDHGRKDNKPMYREDIEGMFEDPILKDASLEYPYTKQKRITISKFVKEHPEGRFFCLHRGHAFAIVDGVLYDHKDAHRRQIYYAVRIYPEKFCH